MIAIIGAVAVFILVGALLSLGLLSAADMVWAVLARRARIAASLREIRNRVMVKLRYPHGVEAHEAAVRREAERRRRVDAWLDQLAQAGGGMPTFSVTIMPHVDARGVTADNLRALAVHLSASVPPTADQVARLAAMGVTVSTPTCVGLVGPEVFAWPVVADAPSSDRPSEDA